MKTSLKWLSLLLLLPLVSCSDWRQVEGEQGHLLRYMAPVTSKQARGVMEHLADEVKVSSSMPMIVVESKGRRDVADPSSPDFIPVFEREGVNEAGFEVVITGIDPMSYMTVSSPARLWEGVANELSRGVFASSPVRVRALRSCNGCLDTLASIAEIDSGYVGRSSFSGRDAIKGDKR